MAPRSARIAPSRGPAVRGFAAVAGRVTGTQPPAVFLTLGRNPRLFWSWLLFAGSMMPGGRLPRRDTELVILRVATLAGSDYELTQHRRLGRRAGLTAEEVDRVALGPAAAGWSDSDRLLLDVTDELHTDEDLSDSSWEKLRAALDERSCLELVMLVGHYRMLATALTTLRVVPDQPRGGR
ncbi:MAG: carboxymuconolactone decarboxylase family protein [Nocardioides sp.]